MINSLERILLDLNIKFISSAHQENYKFKTRDKIDDRILNSAIDKKMDLIITGDNDLLTFVTSKNQNIESTRYSEISISSLIWFWLCNIPNSKVNFLEN